MVLIKENWVFVETDLQKINPVTYQLITKMKQISHDPVVAVLIEKTDANLETELAEYGPNQNPSH
jgi:Electron transfer flavoprotein, alpha subunit